MRKLLLTSTVILGASLGMAQAANLAPDTSTTLSPGQMQVNITMRTNVYFVLGGNSASNYDGNKQAVDSMMGYNRFYFNDTGLAANGLKYGGSIEIRTNYASPASAGASSNSTKNTLYIRRSYVFMGTDKVGTLRVGQTDGAAGLLMLGTFEGFNDGGWNGDILSAAGPAEPTWAWLDVGNYYTTGKIEYLSPNLGGFDFGVSFAPNSTTLQDNSGSAGLTGNASQSTSTSADDAGRATNMVEVAARYRGNFAGFGVAAEAGYLGSGHVNVAAPATQYNNRSLGTAGIELSYAGVTVGGNYIGGAGNNGGGLQPEGGAALSAWIAGAQYTTGPIVIGASYFAATSQGPGPVKAGVGQDQDNGLAAGATYSVAPGLVLYLSYLYGTRHQGGWDFIDSTTGTLNNSVQTQLISLGTRFMW